jgi:hypothetical protein
MALGPFPVEFGTVFPSGAYAAGGVEKVRDFDRSSEDRVIQQIDKHTDLPLWVIEVIDAGPEARQRMVKVAAQYQPVPPSSGMRPARSSSLARRGCRCGAATSTRCQAGRMRRRRSGRGPARP